MGCCVIFVIVSMLLYKGYHESPHINYDSASIPIYTSDLVHNDLNPNHSILKQQDLIRVLNKSYINNHGNYYFSSYGLSNPAPVPYIMYWSLKLNDKLQAVTKGLDTERYIEVMNTTKEFTEPQDFMDLLYKIRIYATLDYHDYDLDDYQSKIMNNFDTESNLFFLKDKNDDINMKLVATREVIETYKILNKKLSVEDPVLHAIIHLYQQDHFFDVNELDNSISSGGVMISILNLLGQDYEGISKISPIKDRMTWVRLVNSNLVDSLNQESPTYFLYLKTILDINRFYGSEFNIPRESLDKSVEAIFVKNKVTLEPLFLNFIIDDYDLLGYKEFPIIQLMSEYVKDSLSSDFNKIGDIEEDITDNFFGLALSKIYNFPVKEDRIKEQLNGFYKVMIEDDSTISDSGKLKNIYYLLLSFKVMNMEVENTEVVSDGVSRYLNKIKISKSPKMDEILDEINDLYIGVKSLQITDKAISSGIQDKIATLALTAARNPDLFNRIELAKLYQLILSTDSRHQEKVKGIKSKILDQLSELKSHYGYKSNLKTDLPSISSTYLAYSIISDNGNLNNAQKDEVKKFLGKAISTDNVSGLHSQYQNLDLGDIYYVVLLSTMCED